MGFFTPLMHKCCKVAFCAFLIFLFSACVFHYSFLHCRDVMSGSLPFTENFHTFAVWQTNVIILPMHQQKSSLMRKVKNCLFQRQLKQEILMSLPKSPPKPPPPLSYSHISFLLPVGHFAQLKSEDLNLLFSAVISLRLIRRHAHAQVREVGRPLRSSIPSSPSRRLLKSSQWSYEQEEKTASSSTLSPSLYCLQQSQFINPKRKERGERGAKEEGEEVGEGLRVSEGTRRAERQVKAVLSFISFFFEN